MCAQVIEITEAHRADRILQCRCASCTASGLFARRFTVALAAILGCSLAVACSSETEGDEDASQAEALSTDPNRAYSANGRDEEISVPPAGTMLVELSQPELLVQLEGEGRGAAQVFGVPGRQDNAALHAASPTYRDVVKSLSDDLAALAQAEPKLTTQVIAGRPRLFNAGWLTSKYASFDLVGVVNRIDRKDMGAPSCGEVRFVYRLAYAKAMGNAVTFSRLPFFLNVVYALPQGDCARAAKAFEVPDGLNSPADYVQYLTQGPLSSSRMSLKQVEVNGQVVRVPSESKTDMGGAAEYFLRVFQLQGNRAVLRPLENTPDVARLRADENLRGELLGWIKSNVRGIDEGTAVMPEKFAATKAGSFTTFGSARMSNKLFSSLFSAQELADANLSDTRLVASAQGLLFRLDDMTCVGCHQGRSVAGFHLLGKERGTRMNPLNALRVHGSPHYLAELVNRKAYFADLARGAEDKLRRTSFHPAVGTRATVGTHCVMPQDQGAFRNTWSCEAGSSCVALAKNSRAGVDLGVCLPEREGFAGLPCLAGNMTDGATPRADKLATQNLGCKGAYACLKPEEGTPAGMCVARCKGRLGTMNGDHEICAYGGGAAFDSCAASGNFASCIEDSVRPAPRQACDEENPCREDYMCQRLESLSSRATLTSTPKGKGFCNPTYFIFQMRLDGHPSPN